MQARLQAILIGVSLCAVFALTGCYDSKALGIGRRPYIPYVPALTFSAEETAKLNQWAAEMPDLFKKLQKHNNTQADLIRKYNELSVDVNKGQLTALTYSADEISATIYSGLRKCGYPAEDVLVKPYAAGQDNKETKEAEKK